MQLYSGTSLDFCRDVTRSQIAGKLETAFFEANRHRPRNEEVTSWRNSLLFMAMCLQEAKLLDHGIALEYQLPLSAKRLDCIVTGRDSAGQPSAAIIELKQWEDVAESDSEDCVITWIKGRHRDVLHPSRDKRLRG
jgi:uncharacterized protein